MIDERDKPDGPPPPKDDAVEILADAAAHNRRRATRRLRVPNDSVPRRGPEDSRVTEESAATPTIESAPAGDESTDTLLRAALAAPPLPVIETLGDDSEHVSDVEVVEEPQRSPSVLRPPTRPSLPPPPPGGGDVNPFGVTQKSAPMVPMDRNLDFEPTTQVSTVRSSRPPPAGGTPSVPRPRSSPPGPRTSSPPPGPRTSSSPPPATLASLSASLPAADEEVSVVRTVRRKIRSVGTGSKPPLAMPNAPEGSASESWIVTVPAPGALPSIPIPSIAAHTLIEDDFVVPPEITPVEAMDVVEETVEPLDMAAVDAVVDETAEEIALSEEEVIAEAKKRPPAPPRSKPSRPPEASARAGGRSPTVEVPKKKRRAWWEELFNDDYFRAMPKFTPEQVKSEGDFIETSLGVEKGAVVMDVGCGDGRQAIELATRGYEVIALDLSLPMLSRAADAAQDRGAKLNFIHSDMREIEFNEMFDAAYCMNTTFGYFDDEKNMEVAQRLHRALKVGGTLLLDVVNRDYAIQNQPSMAWYEGDGCVCMEETSFNYITSRLLVKRTMILDDGRQREGESNTRLYSLHELGKMLHDVGFRIVEVSGHPRTAGAFFGPASRQLIILAQKQKRPSDTAVSMPAVPADPASTATADTTISTPAPTL